MREEIFARVPTPSYVTDEALLKQNLEILAGVKRDTGCHILLAQKAFSMYHFYPLIKKYLDGATASGLFEARLAHEEMGGENHIFSPAYKESEIDEIISLCDHIVFNSVNDYERYAKKAIANGKECGLRINPECSTQEHAIYDPCSPGSRLGVRIADFDLSRLEGISGLHFHTLCEQNSDALKTTLEAVEEKFGAYLGKMKWLNFGGGHHITRPDYDIKTLCECINRIKEKYGVEVYLEPGEAVALRAGFLVTEVLDIVETSEYPAAILDTSAACHMPDVIEMPYRPPLKNSGEKGEKAHTYRLTGPTCLAGDIIGDYSFDEPLKRGDRLVFEDMAIYSMVKNNTFNGMALPAIIAISESGEVETVKSFGYDEFKRRL